MLKTVVGSLFGKFSVVALLVAGAAGGLAVTGEIAGIGMSPNYRVVSSVDDPAASARSGVTLDFPTSVLRPQVAPAGEPATEVVEEVVVVQAQSTRAVPPAAGAAAVAAPRCVADITNALDAIAGAIPSITTGEQGQALLAQANALGTAAGNCAAEARQVGFTGIEGVGLLVNRAGALIAQISAMPGVAAAAAQPAGQPGVVGGVGAVVGGTVAVVGNGLNMLGTGLNMLTSPLK